MTERLTAPPLVSVIVPVYNGERYLRESLDSILAQTYTQMEVLVIDDASTDGTPDIITSYGDRVRCHRQSQNQGIYGNMNDGIAMARGEYIAIYHADDVYDPHIVERQVEFLQRHPEAGAVFCAATFIDPSGRERGQLVLPPEVCGGHPLDFRTIFNALLTYKNRLLWCPTCMVPAAVYRDVGTYRNKEFLNTSDLEMYLRISQNYDIGILEAYLIRYRQGHGNSAQRYHHLRVEPERFFRIMDLYLEQGGRELATSVALTAYEAHRTEDLLMRAISLYILNRGVEARVFLRRISLAKITGSPKIQRWRLLFLFLAMVMLVRLPRMPLLARMFYERWHVKYQKKQSLIRSLFSSWSDPLKMMGEKGLQR